MWTESDITIPYSFTIGKVIVTINVLHPYVDELEIWLTAPDNSFFLLIDGFDLNGENFVDTVLDQVYNK